MDWQSRQHVWVSGHMTTGRSGHRWASGHWEENDGRHYFRNGRWEREPERDRRERRAERRD